jgi:serine/threonine-protein kinase
MTYISPPIEAAWIARAARAALGALAAVHEATDEDGPLAIVHGDVSPANLAISDDASEALLLDFGLASGRKWPRARDGAFRGTLLYAAPEAARGDPIDARADLFALAASLLHAASGEAPRAHQGHAIGPAAFAALLASAAEEPVDAWAARASRPLEGAGYGALARVLVACLAYGRDDRPASARAAAVW